MYSCRLIFLIFSLFAFFIPTSCNKDNGDIDSSGIVTTVDVQSIRRSSVYASGSVAPLPSDTVIMMGFCWNETGSPTVYDNFTMNGNQSMWNSDFTATIQGLKPDRTYHLRAYLSCFSKVFYGNEKVFKTLAESTGILFNPNLNYGTISDIEGNQYKTIELAGKTWMAENLRTTRLNDGSAIPIVEDNDDWRQLKTPALSWCENNEELYRQLYGGFYNWYAVSTGKLCPAGWHVSADAEWKAMEVQLGMSQADAEFWYDRGTTEGKRLKEAGNNNWAADTVVGSNVTGFTGLPGGWRSEYDGSFTCEGILGCWWTSEDPGYQWAVCHSLWSFTSKAMRDGKEKYQGFNVRCIKD